MQLSLLKTDFSLSWEVPHFLCASAQMFPYWKGPPDHPTDIIMKQAPPALGFLLFHSHNLLRYKCSYLFPSGNLCERNFVCSRNRTHFFTECLNHSCYSLSTGQVKICVCFSQTPHFWFSFQQGRSLSQSSETRGADTVSPLLFQLSKQAHLRYPACSYPESLHKPRFSYGPGRLCC